MAKKKGQAPQNKSMPEAPENKAEPKKRDPKPKKIIVAKEYAGIKAGTIIPKASKQNIEYMVSKGYWEVK